MCMCIFGIPVYHHVKVVNSFLMVFNHLVRFCPLVHKPDVCGNFFDAAAEWENRLLKLFYAAVGQT